MDDAGEAALIQLIKNLKLKKTTVIFTTHRPKLLAVADMMLVLKNGQQMLLGPTQEVLSKLNEKRSNLIQQQKQAKAPVPQGDGA